jgi:hypothetical protein
MGKPDDRMKDGDYTDIQVDRNVSIPKHKRTSKYPWHKMEVGDSFYAEIRPQYACAMARKATERLGFKFTTRRWGDGTRIWRVG